MKVTQFADSAVPTAYRSLLGVVGNESSTARAMAANVVRSLVERSAGKLPSLTVTNRLRETLVPLWPELNTVEGSTRLFGAKDWETTVINALSRLGEFAYSGGACYPVPWRLISLGARNSSALLCGTVDPHNISPSLKVKTHGYLRIATRASLPKHFQAEVERWQSALDWLRLDERSIETWTAEWLGRFGAECEVGAPLGCENAQVLYPEVRAGAWLNIASIKKPVEGVRLCRTMGAGKPSKASYFLATLGREHGTISIRQSLELPSPVGSRLSFGLCIQKGTRYKILARARAEEMVLWHVPRLPWPESTLFYSMIKEYDGNGRLNYCAPEELRTLLSYVLGHLGIDLELAAEVDLHEDNA